MGGVQDKPIKNPHNLHVKTPAPLRVSSHSPTVTRTTTPKTMTTIPVMSERDPQGRIRLVEAIKKRDIILFKKAIETFDFKPNDIIGPVEQNKTLLHKLVEYNFAEGMSLLLHMFSNQSSELIQRVVNMKDCDGNTPLLLCCLLNSVETLEVLARDEHVDLEAKNIANKTALEIAMEMESPCVNVLTSLSQGSMASTKNTLKSSAFDNSANEPSLDDLAKGVQSDKDLDKIWDSGSRLSLGESRPSLFQMAQEPSKLDNSRKTQVMKDLQSQGTNFVDVEFPHEVYSVEAEGNEEELKQKYPELTWKRLPEIMGQNYKQAVLFNNFFLADVWKSPLLGSEFYSAIAIAAEFPQRLSRVFSTRELNSEGVCSLNLFIAGVQIEILLDDYFPCSGDSQLVYSRPVANEMWFLFLEKAFAKVYGSYRELAKLTLLETLEILTGMPVSKCLLKAANEDRLWRKLLDCDKKNYMICAGEMKSASSQNINRNFHVISLHEVDGCRLLKIRNHFGHFEWKGDFSINSPAWTNSLREQVGYHSGDKSCFFMTIRDFIKEFEGITICHYHDNWIKNQMNVPCNPNHWVYFEINTERELEAFISVHQKQPEFCDEGPDYNISPVEMIMAKDVDGKNLDCIVFGERGCLLGKPTLYIQEGLEMKLRPGRYILCVKVKWVDEQPHDFYLNVFSSASVKVNQLEASQNQNFLEKVYLSMGALSNDKFCLGRECEFASGWSGSHLWIVAFNRGDKVWNLEIEFEKMQNLKISKKFRSKEGNSIRFTLKPQQKAAAYAKRIGVGKIAFKWKFNQSWE